MLGQNLIARAHQQRKMNHIFQLSGITGPTMAFQHTLRSAAVQQGLAVRFEADGTARITAAGS